MKRSNPHTRELVRQFMEAFVRGVDAELKRRNMTQTELAALIPMSQPNLSRVLNGRTTGSVRNHNVTLRTLTKIATALNLPFHIELVPREPDDNVELALAA